MTLKETTNSSETKYRGIIVNVELDQVTLSDGTPARREVVRHPGGVTVLPLDEQDCVLMVRQWRYPMGCEVLELPAGKLEPGEDPAAAGLRELAEETGYTCARYESLGTIYATPGYCSERLHLFLARELTPGTAHPDEGELLRLERYPLAQAVEMALRDEIHDGKTVAALLKAWILLGRERS